MPYFVYRMQMRGPVRHLEKLGMYPSYSAAALECRRLRGLDSTVVKMVFADNELQAEELLAEVKGAVPNIADDY